MVRLATITRSQREHSRETKFDIEKVQRVANPIIHQFQKAREYQRALNSVKIQKIFAKPFVGTLQGHSDAIAVLSKCPNNLTKLISGSFDGQVRSWDIVERKTLFSLNDHQAIIKGVTFSPKTGQFMITSADDQTINLYDHFKLINSQGQSEKPEPMVRYYTKGTLGNVDHSWSGDTFATSGQVVNIWSYERTKPIVSFQWGIDTVLQVKYNPAEHNLLAGTGIDRTVIIYDIRGQTPLQKISLYNKCQALSWNPVEPINLTVGSHDGNAYTFDLRKMEKALMIHKDHIGAITDLDYGPTGRQFVTSSLDQTIRIFPIDQGKSRQVYHGQRMQQIFAVCWSMDNEYVLSGSDDMNIRIWKSHASQPMGVINKRHENALNYRTALKEKFKYNKEISRISNHRHLPKYILNAKQKKLQKKAAQHRKNLNMELNNPGEWEKPKPEKELRVVEKIE